MTPTTTPISNIVFGPPKDMDETHVRSLEMFRFEVPNGAHEGSECFVSAWKPSAEELKQLNEGACVYLSLLGSVPPHVLTTSFEAATSIK